MVVIRQLAVAFAISAAFLFAHSADASIMTYEVHSTTKVECHNSPHGFWTDRLRAGGKCGAFYDFKKGSTLTVDMDTGKAVLDAVAINKYGYKVKIHMEWKNLTDYDEWDGMVKNGGGGDPSTWWFFEKGKGKAKFFTPSGYHYGTAKLRVVPDSALQVGYGANDKDHHFGGSSWVKYWFKGKGKYKYFKTDKKFGHHWDFNMKLKKVPESATIALMGIGLAGLVLQRRKRHAALRAA